MLRSMKRKVTRMVAHMAGCTTRRRKVMPMPPKASADRAVMALHGVGKRQGVEGRRADGLAAAQRSAGQRMAWQGTQGGSMAQGRDTGIQSGAGGRGQSHMGMRKR